MSVVRQSELDRYAFYLKDLAAQAGVNRHNAMVLVRLLGLKGDERCFKVFRMGQAGARAIQPRSSAPLARRIEEGRIDEARAAYREHLRRRREGPSN